MKKFLPLVLLLVVLIAALVLIMPYVRQPSLLLPVQTPQTTIATSTITENTDVYSINEAYPQFGIPSIDSDIKSKVDAAVSEFQTYPAVPHDSAAVKNDLTGTFDSAYAGPDVVSVRLIFSEYTGGAHPNTAFIGVSYDRTTGKQLTFDDALKMIGLTVQQVSAQASAQFQQQFGDGFFSEGADTNPENYQSFLVTNDTVTFIFGQYQVAAYVYGPQEVSFPRK